MDRRAAAVVSAVWFVLAPLLVGAVLPWWIGSGTGHSLPWPLRALAAVDAVLALLVVAACFVAFVRARGTPVPVAPTERLVVEGFFRYVRNPMYVAVVVLALDIALWHGSWWAAAYGLGVWLLTAGFVVGYEEPTLRRQFGAEYDAYVAAVPRWVPRLEPWEPPRA
jgi:protein-S-isoprenylcysteine O-methyltransferase Ste14